MDNERTTEDDGDASDDDAAALSEFARGLIGFGQDIATVASALRGLTGDARERVISETAQRCRTWGDLGHEAARAITKLQKRKGCL